jgi:hypothetical protein
MQGWHGSMVPDEHAVPWVFQETQAAEMEETACRDGKLARRRSRAVPERTTRRTGTHDSPYRNAQLAV